MNVAVDEVALSLRMFSGAWRLMCAGSPASVISTGGGIEYVFSGIPIPFFNVALLSARGLSSGELERLAAESLRFASGRNVPWLLVTTHEALDAGGEADALLDACGLAPLMPLTGMVAEHIPSRALPPDLHLAVPSDEAGCAALLDVNGAAYAMDLAAGKALVGKPAFWNGHTPVVGTVRDTPVAAAAVLMVDGIRYVALVATDPGHQRRGYADAAMRRALELAAAAHGESPTVLHATEVGRPVYDRMGYRTISNHTVYMEKRFMSGH